jgi:O-antigen ligase
LLLGLIGVAGGIAAQLGVDTTPLHRGDGELGLKLRPAGLQRVGLIAELSLVPFLMVFHDGERLLGRRMRGFATIVLSVVLLAGVTRTLLAVALGVALLRLRSRASRIAAVLLLAAIAFGAARFDVHGAAAPGIRWRIAASALQQASAHPLFGIGPEREVATTGWPKASDPPLGWNAHDTVLDLAARAGLPAAALFVWIFWLALRRARGAVDPLGVALYVGLLATAFDSFSVDLEHFRHVWLLFGLVLARREAA